MNEPNVILGAAGDQTPNFIGQDNAGNTSTWRLRSPVILSVIVHLVALVVLLFSLPGRQTPIPDPEMTVSFETAPPPTGQRPRVARNQPNQIVSPPERIETEVKPPDAVTLRAEKDSVAVKETVKRGEPGAPSKSPIKTDQPAKTELEVPAPTQKQPQPRKPQPQIEKAQVREVRKPGNEKPDSEKPDTERPDITRPKTNLSNKNTAPQKEPNATTTGMRAKQPLKLNLDATTMMDKFSAPKGDSSSEKLDPLGGGGRLSSTGSYRAFTRPAGSGARFIGNGGTNDFLPNLPDGDLTMLNAKADKFAVFVRRVATQVFGQLRQVGWESLGANDVQRIGGFAIVEAILSAEGKLKSVTIKDRSGSERFDSVLVQAANAGAQDRNPPPGAAASDGNIHFIFQAKSWVQFGSNARNGARVEHRWLLLGTGLE